jgi:Mrp family chromosome partitioning ATPase
VSARAGDGRSTLTANLGLALAESGVKTLLIDGCSDGNLSHMLLGDQDDGPGWTDVVDGHADLGTAITTVKVQDSLLWVMRPGRRSGVTSAMLPWSEGGTRLTALVRALELDYYVLIDTPALLPGADGSALTAAAGSILVVVRDNSLAGDLEQVRARLALTGIPASWCVVNHRPPRWSPLARRMRRVPLPEIIAARTEPANTAPKSDPEPPWVGVRGRRSRT